MTIVEQNQAISSSVQIVSTKMTMGPIQIQTMMAGINRFGTKVYWVKDYYSQSTTTLIMITTEYQTAKIPTMTITAYLMKCKKLYVSPVRNRASGITITMVS